MYSAAVPCSRMSLRNAARHSTCVVTSSAVVGSSKIDDIGLGDHRHRRHRALQLPAGDLMRIARSPIVSGFGQIELLEQG